VDKHINGLAVLLGSADRGSAGRLTRILPTRTSVLAGETKKKSQRRAPVNISGERTGLVQDRPSVRLFKSERIEGSATRQQHNSIIMKKHQYLSQNRGDSRTWLSLLKSYLGRESLRSLVKPRESSAKSEGLQHVSELGSVWL